MLLQSTFAPKAEGCIVNMEEDNFVGGWICHIGRQPMVSLDVVLTLLLSRRNDSGAAGWMQVVTPGYVRVVKNEGMPKSKAPGQKGDLKIVFDVAVSLCFKTQLHYKKSVSSALVIVWTELSVCVLAVSQETAELN